MRYIPIMISLLLVLSSISVFAQGTRRVEVFAHRGVLEDVPENTFAALEKVAALGIDGIAVDIRQTKDNQLVLMCDETIDRTTDGKGRVDQLLYAELQQYDAGSWRGAGFRNERVPLLSDVLSFCKINGLKLILNARHACLEKHVLNLVNEFGMSSQVYLWGTLRSLSAEDAESIGRELVFVSPEEMTEEKISRIREEKKYALSVLLENDDRKMVKERIKAGVDVVLVDYPCVAMDILNRESHIIEKKSKNRRVISQQREANNAAYIQEQVKNLVKTMEGEDDDKARTAALSLRVLPQSYTVPPLVKLLEDRKAPVKQNAVWALGFCGDGTIAEYVQALLKDKNTAVRREAVLALKRLGAAQSVPALLETLKTETDVGVKYDIARALGTLGDQSAVFTLSNILTKEKSWYVKSGCVEALGHIASDKAINVLAKTLVADAGEDAAWARTKAAWALAAMGEKSVPVLTRALSDNEEVTRRRAGWALVKIGAPAVKALIGSLQEINKDTRERAARALGWIGDERAATSLIWALKDKEPSVVSSAAWALGRIGNPEALPALRDLVNDKNEDIRENAVEAIEKIVAFKEKTAYYPESAQ